MCKSNDRVSWNFPKAVLSSMNFSGTWINQIVECITSAQYAILLNGSPTQPFHPSKGLRQGDPISLYMFLFYTNILSIALTQAKTHKKIKGITIGRRGVSFTHLLFADDSIFLFQNDKHSILNLKDIILWYRSISGQCINFAKFDLFCSSNIPTNIQKSLAKNLQVNLVQIPSKYLGTNFKLRRRRVIYFQDLVDKVQAKLQGWKVRIQSQEGRTTLIALVLQSIPLYTFSCFKVPETICNKLDTTIRAFWWDMNWVLGNYI